jgi:histidinol-phosphate aminotransferase
MTSPRDLFRPELAGLAAYHVADAAGMVKLDAMENPYALPEDLRAELGALLGAQALNRYPDPAARALVARLRATQGIPDDASVLLGNGSDELIQMLILALAPGATVLGVEPAFVMYRLICAYCGVRFASVPLRADFSLDAAALLAAIERDQPALIFLAYPNNPTGNLFDDAVIERVLAAAPGLVIIDEAYHPFAQRSWMGRLANHPRLLAMRTLSKLGLAGLRLGYLAGGADWIAELDKLRLPYNINALTQAAALAVLNRPEVLESQAAAIRAERAALARALAALPGVTVYPSAANFLLLRVANATSIFDALKSSGILIKHLHGSHPMLENCLRVTVGTPEENLAFLTTLSSILDHA